MRKEMIQLTERSSITLETLNLISVTLLHHYRIAKSNSPQFTTLRLKDSIM